MKKYILTIAIILTGNPYMWQYNIAEKWGDLANVSIEVTDEQSIDGLWGYYNPQTDEIRMRKTINGLSEYGYKKYFEYIMVHEILHYKYPNETEKQIRQLTKNIWQMDYKD